MILTKLFLPFTMPFKSNSIILRIAVWYYDIC